MGGYGSGRRPGKTKADGIMSVDLRYLNRNSFLVAGRTDTLWWTRRGRVLGQLIVTAEKDKLLLRWLVRQHQPDVWAHTEQSVPLTWTTCNYGGARPFFLCPCCNKRVLILYVGCTRLGCRHCYQLTYASRNEGMLDQQFRRVWKIRERLGAKRSLTVPIGPKPKSMHRRTFKLLKGHAEQLEQEIWGAMWQQISGEEL